VGNGVQRSENMRKNSFLNYESPALTAELQARFRDANIQYSPSNVQHSMSEDGLLGKKFGLRIAGRGFGMEACFAES
jgi:hypothetical protein